MNRTANINIHPIASDDSFQQNAARQFEQKEELVDLGQYFKAVWKRWPMILGFTLLSALLATLVAYSITPVYRATATLLIEADQRKAVSIEDVVGVDTSKQEYYLTQFELLKSRTIAQKVIDKYGLEKLPEFNGDKPKTTLDKFKNPVSSLRGLVQNSVLLQSMFDMGQGPSEIDLKLVRKHTVMESFRERLSISPVRKTQLVKISFDSEDKRLAADIANAVGEAYIEGNRDARLQASREATTWLEDRLTKLKSAVTKSEQRLTAFLEQEGLLDVSGIDSLASTELADLSRRLSDARDRRVAAESLYFVLQDNRSAGLANLSSISAISNHPQLRDVRMAEIEAERLVSELSKRYGPKHDKMVQAQAQLASVKERANMLLSGLASGIEKELRSARRQESALQADLDSKKGQFQGIAVKRATFDALKREVESNRKLYDLFLNRQKQTAATTDFQTAVARFSDRAIVPLNAAKPRKGLLVFLVLVMSLIVASFLSYFLAVFNNSIEKAQDVTEKLGLTPLGAIPLLKLKKSKKRPISSDVFFDDNFNRFSESIRTLRTSILLNMMNQEGQTICITSSAPGEGKSTVSMNLAIAMASMEKVLLIEGDLRRPSLGGRFSLAAAHPGISNHLVMNADLDDCIYIHQKSGLHVLSAGALIKSPQELLASEKFAAMFAQLSQSYDRIVIDSPPLLAVSDALILAKYADSALLVVGAGQTRIKQLKDAIASLFNHQVPVEGVVVNKVSHKASSKSNDYGYYGYSS
ncbi:GumC family protein [Agarivorans aestuarii]|uniref:GumC family protein n=1 Tax=Agarivorans aestuarii TaxID=1563703 RepID=UPI001C7F6820|nr:polysaccharide biosynthesis tyrosine autokinase [Agarivorans aestuarii]